MPKDLYILHRIACDPLRWKVIADEITKTADARLAPGGGALYGAWRSQIGRPRDELNIVTVWPEAAGTTHAAALTDAIEGIRGSQARIMRPTLRPAEPIPPVRQGNYAFRWFETPPANWDEFLSLCAAAWPGFEAAYDSQVVGLWRFDDAASGNIASLMITRRPNLAMWERTKIPQGEAEAEVRRKLSRRYDLCDATWVETATLLTATDAEDTARWT